MKNCLHKLYLQLVSHILGTILILVKNSNDLTNHVGTSNEIKVGIFCSILQILEINILEPHCKGGGGRINAYEDGICCKEYHYLFDLNE